MKLSEQLDIYLEKTGTKFQVMKLPFIQITVS